VPWSLSPHGASAEPPCRSRVTSKLQPFTNSSPHALCACSSSQTDAAFCFDFVATVQPSATHANEFITFGHTYDMVFLGWGTSYSKPETDGVVTFAPADSSVPCIFKMHRWACVLGTRSNSSASHLQNGLSLARCKIHPFCVAPLALPRRRLTHNYIVSREAMHFYLSNNVTYSGSPPFSPIDVVLEQCVRRASHVPHVCSTT
jgi:hypothetical protein